MIEKTTPNVKTENIFKIFVSVICIIKNMRLHGKCLRHISYLIWSPNSQMWRLKISSKSLFQWFVSIIKTIGYISMKTIQWNLNSYLISSIHPLINRHNVFKNFVSLNFIILHEISTFSSFNCQNTPDPFLKPSLIQGCNFPWHCDLLIP